MQDSVFDIKDNNGAFARSFSSVLGWSVMTEVFFNHVFSQFESRMFHTSPLRAMHRRPKKLNFTLLHLPHHDGTMMAP